MRYEWDEERWISIGLLQAIICVVVHVERNDDVIRMNADVLEWFKSQGPGYQTRINQLLRKYMEAQG